MKVECRNTPHGRAYQIQQRAVWVSFKTDCCSSRTTSTADPHDLSIMYLSAPDANLSPRVSAFRTMRTLDKMLRPAFCHLSTICSLRHSSSSLSLNTPAPPKTGHVSVCLGAPVDFPNDSNVGFSKMLIDSNGKEVVTR